MATMFPIIPPLNRQPAQYDPNGTGAYQSDLLKKLTTDQSIDQMSIPINPEDLNQALENARGMKPFVDQRENLNRMIDMAKANVTAPSQVDLTPLAALTDAWTGSKFSQTYQKPKGLDEQQKEGFNYLNAIQGQEDKYNDNVMNTVKTLLTGGGTKVQKGTSTSALENKVGNDPSKIKAPARPQVNNAMEKTWTEFKNANKKTFEAIDAAKEARALINQGTTVADQMLKRQLIRLSGDQRPSDKDIDAFGGDSRLLSIAQQFYDSKFDTGTFSALNRQQMAAVVDGLEAVARRRLDGTISGYVTSARDFHPDLDPVVVERGIRGRIAGIHSAQTTPKATSESKPQQGGGSPVGTIKAGRGGVQYKKTGTGPDNVRENWTQVK